MNLSKLLIQSNKTIQRSIDELNELYNQIRPRNPPIQLESCYFDLYLAIACFFSNKYKTDIYEEIFKLNITFESKVELGAYYARTKLHRKIEERYRKKDEFNMKTFGVALKANKGILNINNFI